MVVLIFHKMPPSRDKKVFYSSSTCNSTELLWGAIWLVRTVNIQGSNLMCLSLSPDWFHSCTLGSPLAVSPAFPKHFAHCHQSLRAWLTQAQRASSTHTSVLLYSRRAKQRSSLLASGCMMGSRKWWPSDPGALVCFRRTVGRRAGWVESEDHWADQERSDLHVASAWW